MSEGAKATFFVSPLGNDAWSGGLPAPDASHADGPFATVARARDAVRALKAVGPLTAPVSVLLRAGTYSLGETLVFTSADSGTAACPITYAAYPNERPVLSGARPIRASWRPYREGIMVTAVPGARNGGWPFRQLIVDGQRQTRARLPRTDYYRIAAPVPDEPAAFRFRPGEISSWDNLSHVEAVVLHSWNESRLRIASVDKETQIVRFTGAPEPSHPFGWEGARGPNRYYIENLLEAVQQPGDWYLDYQTGELYYWPQPGANLADAQVMAPVLKQLVRFEGQAEGENPRYIEHIHFAGLTFGDTDDSLGPAGYPGCGDVGDIIAPSMLGLEGAAYCAITDCCLRNSGTYALELAGYRNQVIGNEILATGGGGIITRNLASEQNVISYNHIHDCGVSYPSAVGINIDDGGGIFAHNLIHDVPQSGIYARHWATKHQPLGRRNQAQQLVIEYNEIYNVVTRINDGGGLFVRDANMFIRNNLIHDVYSHGEGTPGWGIYLGCESRESVIRDNLVYRSRESLHMLWANRHNVLENNIFVDGLKTQIKSDNWEGFQHEDLVLRRNVFCYAAPEATLFRFQSAKALPAESDYNLYFHADGLPMTIQGLPGVPDWAAWQAQGFDVHSVVADPQFVDPARDDYTFRASSPALKLGIKPIDVSSVGLRGSRYDHAQ